MNNSPFVKNKNGFSTTLWSEEKNIYDKINHHLWQVGYVKRDTQSLAPVRAAIAIYVPRVETISSQTEVFTIFT